MKRTVTSWLLLFSLALLGFAGAAFAANKPCTVTAPVPCKYLRIFNNNPAGGSNIYVFFESFIQDPLKADLWMQAYFNLGADPKVTDWVKVGDHYESPRKFVTTRIRRGYIQIGDDVTGNGEGIPPGTSVDIVLPFYTQLLTTTDANLGKIPDQYIDWWNSGRIYFFDTPAAYHSTKVTNANSDKVPGGQLPPPPVKVLAGAKVPSCTSSSGKKCTVTLFENAIEPIANIPFQLQEYTLASAEGPPEDNTQKPPGRTAMQLDFVNYNVSSLDSVFLPVAMGPLTEAGDSVDKATKTPTPYVGTALTTVQFRQTLDKFSSSGNNWPFFVPAYFDDKVHAGFPGSPAKACSLAPFKTNSTGQYNLPKLPGAFDLITGSYLGARVDDGGGVVFPPVPPTMSSNPANYQSKYTANTCTLPTSPPFVNPPKLGVAGKSFIDLWNKCYPGTSDQSQTCNDIRTVAKLFVADSYFGNKACTNPQTPPFYITMQGVYGWVPIVNRGCTGLDLKKTPSGTDGYFKAAAAYCRLQYNYVTLSANDKATYTFNPYTALIHAPYKPTLGGGLNSSAYAFSIDDKLSFKHVEALGIVLAIAGTKGIEFDKNAGQTGPVPTPIPSNAKEIKCHCKIEGAPPDPDCPNP